MSTSGATRFATRSTGVVAVPSERSPADSSGRERFPDLVDDLEQCVDLVSAQPDSPPFLVIVLFGHHGYLPFSPHPDPGSTSGENGRNWLDLAVFSVVIGRRASDSPQLPERPSKCDGNFSRVFLSVKQPVGGLHIDQRQVGQLSG